MKRLSSKTIFYLIFSVALLALFYGMLLYNNPSFGKQAQSVISKVQDFSFLNQYGDTITKKDILGKVCVVSYFFVHCEGICPQMNEALYRLYKVYGKRADFIMLTHTVEPERDSVSVLYAYAQAYPTYHHNWFFLTGSKTDLYQMARYSYILDDPNNNVGSIKDQFLHTQFVALVNKKSEVVGVYDLLRRTEVEKLREQLASLFE